MPKLKKARAERLFTVRGLANAAGVAPSTVYLIENGRVVPRFDVIRKLSAALGMNPAEIDEFAAAIAEVGRGKSPLSQRQESRRRHDREPTGRR